MPKVADGVTIRWVDIASPWLRDVGGDVRGTRLEAAAIARVALRFNEARYDLVHDEEFEAVLVPLGEDADMSSATLVDYDDRDLLGAPQDPLPYRLGDAPIATKTFWTRLEKSLVDHLYRERTLQVPFHRQLKMAGRPGESPEAFLLRCRAEADRLADAEAAKLKDKYQAKLLRLKDQIQAAEGRVGVLEQERNNRRTSELFNAVDSVLGGFLGGRRSRRSMVNSVGKAAGARGRSATANERVDAAKGKLDSLVEQYEQTEQDCTDELLAIDQRWAGVAEATESLDVALKRTDIVVKQFVLGWVPVP
jgi:hypothetical protein